MHPVTLRALRGAPRRPEPHLPTMSEALPSASHTVQSVLLVFPPHTRNTEPPLGVALIAAFLKSRGVTCHVLDLNAVAAPGLALAAKPTGGHRSCRAVRHVSSAIGLLRGHDGYTDTARYRSRVEFYASALKASCVDQPWLLTPGDFTDSRISDYGPSSVERAISIAWDTPWIPVFDEVLAPSLDRFSPCLLGISVTYRSQFLPSLALAAWVRGHAPSLRVVWGGPFLDSLPRDTLAWMSAVVGTIVLGPGEPELAALLGIPPPADGVFREPCFDGIDPSAYFAPVTVIPLAASRGCYWRRCAFCAEAPGAFCADGHDSLFARLEALAVRHGRCLIHFTDNAIPPATLAALAGGGSPAPWYGFVRPTESLAEPAFVQALAEGGCVMLQVGLETASQSLLEKMHKGTDPELYPRILANLTRAGIKSYVYLLFGYPGEGDADRAATLRFCCEHPADFLNASIFRLAPAASVVKDLREAGRDLLAESGHRYLQLTDDAATAIRRWLSGSFFRHPAVKAMAARTPRYYKSSHAPFL